MRIYSKKIEIHKADLWKDKSLLLRHLDVELTERCNNNCIHCYINIPADDVECKKKELSTKAIRKILDEAASLGCLSVRYTGGEPLIRDDFEDIYLYTRRLGIKVTIFTNATLITPHLAKLFVSIPPLENIEVSVYGMTKGTYEAVTRTPGSFNAAFRGINLLLEKNIPFVVKSAILPCNKQEIEDFESWASTIPWMDGGPSYTIFFDLHGRRNKDKSRLIEKLRASPEEGLKLLLRINKEYVREMNAFCAKFLVSPGSSLFSCGVGRGSGCVDAYGRFQICMMLRHPDTVFDLKHGSLREAMTKFFVKVREIKASNPLYLMRCARCFLRGFCEQCPAKSWMEHGTLDTPVEYFCEIAHTQARFLGLLQEGEKAWEVKDWKKRLS